MVRLNTQRIKEESEALRSEMRERTLGFVVAAFGLVAGLAWNDAIKALIEFLFPLSTNTLLAKFGYAASITVIVVVATVYITRVLKKKEKDEDSKI